MRYAAIPVVALLLLAASARADDVILHSGRTLSGRIVKETDTEITFEYRGGNMTIARTQIKEIKRGPAPEGTDAPPTPAAAPEKGKDPKAGAGDAKGTPPGR